jgi:hypothetical protein
MEEKKKIPRRSAGKAKKIARERKKDELLRVSLSQSSS